MEKLCVNCKHCETDNQSNPAFFRCLSPKNSERLNLVNGEHKRIYIYCVAHRSSNGFGCKKDGLFFEEK